MPAAGALFDAATQTQTRRIFRPRLIGSSRLHTKHKNLAYSSPYRTGWTLGRLGLSLQEAGTHEKDRDLSTGTERAAEPIAAVPTGARFLAVFPSIMLPMFLAVTDSTIVASALPQIAATIGDVERVSWIVVGYLLANTVAAPVYGYLGDTFGRRALMVAALVLFIVASILCAISPSVLLLTGARVLQGLGGGGLMSLSQALIGEAVPPRQRGHYQGYLSAVVTASSAFGPVAGGFLTQTFGWRSVFLVNVPLGLIAIAMTFRLPSRRAERQTNWSFDWGGLLFFSVFIVPVLLALERMQQFEVGSLPGVLLLIAVSAGSLVTLVFWERRQSAPLIPISLLRQRPIWMADGMAVFHGAALTALVAFLPIYMRVVRGATAAETGMLLLPVTAGLSMGSLVVGRIVTRTGYTMLFPSLGLPVATALFLIFVFAVGSLTYWQIVGLLTLTAISMGTVMGVVQVTVQGTAGARLLGAGAASVQLSRSVGAAIGTATLGTILFASLSGVDPEASRLFGTLLDHGPEALSNLEPARRDLLTGEIAHAFRSAFLILPIFTALGAVLAWFQPVRRV